MRRIRKNACGYGGSDGYTCLGDQNKLTGQFISTGLVADTLRIRQADRLDTNIVHNYMNLPTAFQGMLITGVPIVEVDTGSAVQEVTCKNVKSRLDIKTGWMFDVNSKISTKALGGAYTSAATENTYTDLYGNAPLIFKEYSSEQPNTYIPGVLEPMLATDFSPTALELLPASTFMFDGIAAIFNSLGKWRTYVNQILLDLLNKGGGGSSGFSTGLNMLPTDSGCNGGIHLEVTDKTKLRGLNEDPEPTFKLVYDSTTLPIVIINGRNVTSYDTKSTSKQWPANPSEDWGSQYVNGFDLFMQIPYKFGSVNDLHAAYIVPSKIKFIITNDSRPASDNDYNYIYMPFGGVRRSVVPIEGGEEKYSAYSYNISTSPCAPDIVFDKIYKAASNSGSLVPTTAYPTGNLKVMPTMWTSSNHTGIVDWDEYIKSVDSTLGTDYILSTMCVQIAN